jgi:antitoxin component of MazEF toxin-antitoxin module
MISKVASPMTTRIVRVGNTLSVEIPEELVAESSLPVGEPVEWVPNGTGSLTLVNASKSAPGTKNPADMTIEELMEGLNEEDSLGEYDWGPPRGVEVW